ncbi:MULTISPECIES: ABC transporter permease [unclassified Alteromonas]|uniref:ABC transporter permease n=1 Tax=unclassified Alteromonas TaxID=2614992 RepID=UPI00050968B5|nr:MULTISPECIES: ABC transporter permease [unclassified Alteromonas]
MHSVSYKLTLDLASNWWRQFSKQWTNWFGICLLGLPIAFFAQVLSIISAYENPSFAAIKHPEKIVQVSYKTADNQSALPFYLAQELTRPNAGPENIKGIAYQKNAWLKSGGVIKRDVYASFFSGGYEYLGISPLKGSLEKLEFPNANEQIHVAISYSLWQALDKGDDIIGETLQIGAELLIISAVMPQEFIGLRPGSKTDLLIPYAYIERLNVGTFDGVSPDTYSYLLTSSANPVAAERLEAYLQQQALFFDDEKLEIIDAFGISASEFVALSSRLERLKYLFLVLLIFSAIAFLSNLCDDLERRQNEHELRKMIGANKQQLFAQLMFELILTLSAVATASAAFYSMSPAYFNFAVPELQTAVNNNWISLMRILSATLLPLFGIAIILFSLQRKVFASSLGRGTSISLGVKLQAFFLLAVMISISCISITKSVDLSLQQYAYYQKDRGFDESELEIVTFDIPRFGGTFYTNELPELVIQNIEQIEGIKHAAITTTPFLKNQNAYTSIYTQDLRPLGGKNNPGVLTSLVSPNFFEVAGIELIKGNTLTWGNRNQAVISEALYHKFFDGQTLSQMKLLIDTSDNDKQVIDVVGVANDVHLNSIDDIAEPIVYQVSPTLLGVESLLIRTKLSSFQVEKAVDTGLKNIDARLSNPTSSNLEALIDEQEAPQRALITTSLLVTVVLLSTTILFSYNSINILLIKSQREIALRLSLGAMVFDIVKREMLTYLIVGFPVALLTLLFSISSQKDILLQGSDAILHYAGGFSVLSIVVLVTFLFGVQRTKKVSWQALT